MLTFLRRIFRKIWPPFPLPREHRQNESSSFSPPEQYVFLRNEMLAKLGEFQRLCYTESAAKGWHPNDAHPDTDAEIDRMSSQLMCMHEELSELWQAIRSAKLRKPCDKADKMTALGLEPLTNGEEEAADVLIRLCDFCEEHGINLAHAAAVKLLFNRSRPHRHGGKTR